MKKVYTLIVALVLVGALVACKPKEQRDPDTYYLTTSDTKNTNPYSETNNTASTIYDLVTDSLFTTDFDWEEAVQKGVASKKGDFSKVDELGYNYYPSMAASRPTLVKADGTVDNDDKEESKALLGNKWIITLKQDLKFVDGTVINADTFEYSWKQLLSPNLNNARATNLYDKNNLPIVGAEAYFKQGKQVMQGGNGVWLDGEKEVAYYAYVNSVIKDSDEKDVKLYKALEGKNEVLAKADGYKVDAQGNYILNPTDNTKIAVEIQYTWADNKDTHLTTTKKYENVVVSKVNTPKGLTTKKVNPVASWEQVGFAKKSDYSFEISLAKDMTQWDVMAQMASALTSVVHPAKYEAGLNAEKTVTTYGTIDNPLISFGPYKLVNWQDGVVFAFDKNEAFHDAENYSIKKIRYNVLADQTAVLNEFKSNKIDAAGVGGEFFAEFKNNPLLKESPTTSTFRLAFNMGGRGDGKKQTPLLGDRDFRQALYFAIDREEFATTVRPPSIAQQGLISNIHKSLEEAKVVYRESNEYKEAFKDLSPETYGFNAVKAKELFNKAYKTAVETQGNGFNDGDKVIVDYVMYEVDSNRKVADWVKSTTEKILGDKFVFNVVGLSSTGLDAAWDNKDFDLTFGGWTGMLFNPAGLMSIVYNEKYTSYMLENGFTTSTLPVSFKLSDAGLEKATTWISEQQTELTNDEFTLNAETAVAAVNAEVARLVEAAGKETDAAKKKELNSRANALSTYASYKALVDSRTNGVVTTQLEISNDFKDEVLTSTYEGKESDYNAITAAIESTLVKEAIAIPLMISSSATVYSTRVDFQLPKYHSVMGWGGLRYTSLNTSK